MLVNLVHPHRNRVTICLIIENTIGLLILYKRYHTRLLCEGRRCKCISPLQCTWYKLANPSVFFFVYLITGIHGINQCEYLDRVASLNCRAKGLLYLNSAILNKELEPLQTFICILLKIPRITHVCNVSWVNPDHKCQQEIAEMLNIS